MKQGYFRRNRTYKCPRCSVYTLGLTIRELKPYIFDTLSCPSCEKVNKKMSPWIGNFEIVKISKKRSNLEEYLTMLDEFEKRSKKSKLWIGPKPKVK